MSYNKITAVVVTYNRLNCLKKVVGCLKSQSYPLQQIIIINNGATDGTYEWLNSQSGLVVIHQDNVGGSGGFYRGIQEALKYDNDWVWCMDDDVYPRQDCLEHLLKESSTSHVGILCPQRIQNNKIFISEFKKLNLSNPFLKLHQKVLTEDDFKNGTSVEIEGMVFEGPLIKRQVIDSIGLPNQDLFILYDDTDYSYRAVEAGYKVLYIPHAVMDKEYFDSGMTRNEMLHKNRWKTWYHIRNTAYFCKHHAKNSIYRLFGGIGLPIHMVVSIMLNLPRNNKYEIKDLFMVIKMFSAGRRGVLGKMV